MTYQAPKQASCQDQQSDGLSREFVIRSVLAILDDAQTGRKWGRLEVAFQNGRAKTIRKEETITTEAQS